jgi:transposase
MNNTKQYIGCDVHRDYSVFRMMDERGDLSGPLRVGHRDGEMQRFLKTLPPESPVAIETCGGWMWMVRAMEEAGLEPHLAHALKVKQRIAGPRQTDESDAGGLAMLLRNGTLPEVWIAPPGIRDLRGLVRSRLAIRRYQTCFKNRIHGTLNQYGVKHAVEAEDDVDVRDWFSVQAQAQLMKAIDGLPTATREALRQEYLTVRELERRIQSLELAIKARIGNLGWLRLLRTLPGVGPILSATIWLEIGDIRRFASAQNLALYAGLVPSVQSSGGKTWRGPVPKSCNPYLKWTFVEAANVVALRQKTWEEKYPHAVSLYRRVKATTKISGKAKVAVARHLAEATWWMLTRKQDYREPTSARSASSSSNG